MAHRTQQQYYLKRTSRTEQYFEKKKRDIYLIKLVFFLWKKKTIRITENCAICKIRRLRTGCK